MVLSQPAAVEDVAEAGPPVEVGSDSSTYVRTRSARLVRAAYLLTGDRQLAEDLVQTALAKVSPPSRWRPSRIGPAVCGAAAEPAAAVSS